jgi:hypothetical protein
VCPVGGRRERGRRGAGGRRPAVAAAGLSHTSARPIATSAQQQHSFLRSHTQAPGPSETHTKGASPNPNPPPLSLLSALPSPDVGRRHHCAGAPRACGSGPGRRYCAQAGRRHQGQGRKAGKRLPRAPIARGGQKGQGEKRAAQKSAPTLCLPDPALRRPDARLRHPYYQRVRATSLVQARARCPAGSRGRGEWAPAPSLPAPADRRPPTADRRPRPRTHPPAPILLTTPHQRAKQLEFYFSDSNLPKDKFLRAQAEAHPDGLVDLSLLLSFSRMRALLGVSLLFFVERCGRPGPPPPLRPRSSSSSSSSSRIDHTKHPHPDRTTQTKQRIITWRREMRGRGTGGRRGGEEGRRALNLRSPPSLSPLSPPPNPTHPPLSQNNTHRALLGSLFATARWAHPFWADAPSSLLLPPLLTEGRGAGGRLAAGRLPPCGRASF